MPGPRAHRSSAAKACLAQRKTAELLRQLVQQRGHRDLRASDPCWAALLGTAFAFVNTVVTDLGDKVENALNETRMLILGSQVLLGFQYQGVFQPGFQKLPPLAQELR